MSITRRVVKLTSITSRVGGIISLAEDDMLNQLDPRQCALSFQRLEVIKTSCCEGWCRHFSQSVFMCFTVDR